MLVLESHFEGVLAINLCEIICDLDSRTNLIRGEECVASQSGKSLDSKCRQSAILMFLRNGLNSKLAGNVAQIVCRRRDTSRVQVIQACARNVDGAWRENVR